MRPLFLAILSALGLSLPTRAAEPFNFENGRPWYNKFVIVDERGPTANQPFTSNAATRDISYTVLAGRGFLTWTAGKGNNHWPEGKLELSTDETKLVAELLGAAQENPHITANHGTSNGGSIDGNIVNKLSPFTIYFGPSGKPSLRVLYTYTKADGTVGSEYVPLQGASLPQPRDVLRRKPEERLTTIKVGERIVPVAIVDAPEGLAGPVKVVLRSNIEKKGSLGRKEVAVFSVPGAAIRIYPDSEADAYAGYVKAQGQMNYGEEQTLNRTIQTATGKNPGEPAPTIEWDYGKSFAGNVLGNNFSINMGICEAIPNRMTNSGP